MTATTPQPLEGTQAPNQIEYLYERYKHLLSWVLVAIVAAFAVHYGWKWQRQSAIDKNWTQFSASIGLEGTYTDPQNFHSLTDLLVGKDLGDIDGALAQADANQKPFLLLAIARKAMIERQWDRAEAALKQLEEQYPNHSLVQVNPYPVQVREVIESDDPPETPPDRNKKPEFKDAVAGSVVSRMREQIGIAKGFTLPQHFAKPEIPADAPRVKFELSGDYGSFVIALMPQAPEHTKKFLELVEAGFWKDINVDEVQRDGKGIFAKRPMQFHLGFTTTKDPERSKWTKTDPSGHLLPFEETGLSHFAGAVAGRAEADGKSCADRFWVCAEDAAGEDGRRVVFGYIVEGLENVQQVCEAAMTAQEEENGQGVPSDKITVVSVSVLPPK